MAPTLTTPLCELLGIKHPIILAGMNGVATAPLAAAVSNAGGLGVIGGVGYTPKKLQEELDELKALLEPGKPFGVDLLLPQVGGNARKTNKDYTNGALPELIDIIIASKPALFVSAVGVPPKWAVDKLHAAGILVQNMVGHPKHALKALEVGVDIICAQGTEGGGHTGPIASTVLFPQVADILKGKVSPLTGKPVHMVAAGGIFDGRGLAAALTYGAQAVWVGTRFIASTESAAGPMHVNAVLKAGADETIRTTVYTGRPMRVLMNDFAREWEEDKHAEKIKIQNEGTIIAEHYMNNMTDAEQENFQLYKFLPLLMGQAIGGVNKVEPAKKIIEDMVEDAVACLKTGSSFAKL
jgi:NAD(P)H-dependent flavin oxidoreductase YrpB (nitropropane dioxygenase family)